MSWEQRRRAYPSFAQQCRELDAELDRPWRAFLDWLATGNTGSLYETYEGLMAEPLACPGLACQEWVKQLAEARWPNATRLDPALYPGYADELAQFLAQQGL